VASLAPWLAVAGLGALHGMNPACGWLWAATRGVRSRDRSQVLRSLLPVAVGHAASIAVVAASATLGLVMAMDRAMLQAVAGALLAIVVARHLVARSCPRTAGPAGHAGPALASFMMSTAHGIGTILVPALLPLCLSDSPAREITASGSLILALAAVGVHMAAMLGVAAAIALGVCGVFGAGDGRTRRQASQAAIADLSGSPPG